jgi:hypothetical protein
MQAQGASIVSGAPNRQLAQDLLRRHSCNSITAGPANAMNSEAARMSAESITSASFQGIHLGLSKTASFPEFLAQYPSGLKR